MNRRERRTKASQKRREKHPKMDFNCPFCGLFASADAGAMSVAHAEPMCETFKSLNPLEFMQAVREKVAGVASEVEG